MRRVKAKVTDEEAGRRLLAYRRKFGRGPHKASAIAEAIWPDAEWIAPQGAGAAASRVIKRLGHNWVSRGDKWGWMI